MASTFSPTLRIELIGDGDQSGIWGQTTNTNLGTLLEQAITGVVSITMVDANYTLTNFNGVSDEARNQVIVATGTNAAVRDIIAPLVEKTYTIQNSTTGGFGVRIIGPSGTGVTIPNGVTTTVYCNGTNFLPASTGSTTDFAVAGNLTVSGNETLAGNLTFTGSGKKITGDFNSTNRVVVQNATTNSETAFTVVPNGTGASSNIGCANAPDLANTSSMFFRIDASVASIYSFKTGTGTYLPLNFNVNNAERMRITTAGGISFGASGTNFGTAGQILTSAGDASPTWTNPFPSGGIIMWSGSIASIPSGWLLCNGSSGTPDLRDRFVVGAGSTYAVNATGGAATVTLSTTNLPSHTHSISASGTTSSVNLDHLHSIAGSGNTGAMSGNQNHSHGVTDPGHSHATNYDYASNQPGASDCNVSGTPTNIFVNGTQGAFTGVSIQSANVDHTHSFSFSGNSGAMNTNQAHTHTVTVTGTSGATGSGTAFSILPPYYALAFIMKS
jgi:hypothetical protein